MRATAVSAVGSDEERASTRVMLVREACPITEVQDAGVPLSVWVVGQAWT